MVWGFGLLVVGVCTVGMMWGYGCHLPAPEARFWWVGLGCCGCLLVWWRGGVGAAPQAVQERGALQSFFPFHFPFHFHFHFRQ